MMRLFHLSLGLLLLAGFRVGAQDEGKPAAGGRGRSRAGQMPEDFKGMLNDIVFKQVGEKELVLMVLPPLVKKYEKAPLVLYIHGGGWGGGDRYRMYRPDVQATVRGVSKLGFVCASLEYRLIDGKPTTAMDAVADCKDGLRFLVAHAAEYGIDPERVGTFGSSAGGHLTLVTALGKEADYPCDHTIPGPEVKVKCVAAFYPLTSLLDPLCRKGSNFERPVRAEPLLGGPLEQRQEVAKKLSPLELVHAGSPAIFVGHGDKDPTLPFYNSTAMRDAAVAKGVPVECVISQGAGHGFSGQNISPSIPEIAEQAVAFFVKNLAP